MHICLMQDQELIKGTLKTIVLQLLKQHGQMYGYEITQKVKLLTHNEVQLTEGALYPTLHKLEASGSLVTEKVHIGKRVRKYYRLTAAGERLATQKAESFASFVQVMQGLLYPNGTEPKKP